MTSGLRLPAVRPQVLVEVVAWLCLLVFTVGAVGPALGGSAGLPGHRRPHGLRSVARPGRDSTGRDEHLDRRHDRRSRPRTVYVADGFASGDVAQWNPYVAGGTPAVPLPDNAPFSPLSLPWYVVPSSYAPGLVKLLEIVTVTVGMLLLGRRMAMPRAASVVAATAYLSCGFMIAWTNWTQTRVAAFLPLLLWAVDRAAVSRRARDMVPIALVVAAMVAGGFPSVTGFSLYLCGAWALVRTLGAGWRSALRPLAICLAGVVAGVALTAWQVLPFVLRTLSVVDLEARVQTPEDHLGWPAVATAVVPGILGGPSGQWWGSVWNPVENFSYLGVMVVALVLVLLAARRSPTPVRGMRTFVLAGLVVCLVLVHVGGVPLGLVQQLPVFENNFVGRLRVVVGFLAAVGAGLGLTELMRERGPGDTAPRTPGARARVAAAVLAVVALAATVVRVTTSMVPADRQDEVLRGAVVAGGLAAAAAAVVVLARVGPRGRLAAGVLVPLLVAVPALAVARTWWPLSPPETFYPTTAVHDFLDDELGHDRFVTVDQAMLPSSNTLYRLRTADGHAFATSEWIDLMTAVDPQIRRTVTYMSLTSGALDTSLSSGVLDRLAVRFVVLPPGVIPPGERETLGEPAGEVALGDGASAERTLVGPLRGVLVDLPAGMQIDADGARLVVDVVGADGTHVQGVRVLDGGPPAGATWVPVAGEDVAPDEEVSVRISVEGASAPTPVTVDAQGQPVLQVLRPQDDGLRVVLTDDATVLERTTALPRIRWADDAEVLPDASSRIEAMDDGDIGPRTVVLQDPADAEPADRGAPHAGAPEVDVVVDGTDRIEIDVTTGADGWLVIADAVQGAPGWSATIDGDEVEILDAEHAGAALEIDEGEHRVVLTYTMPGAAAGGGIAVGTGLVLVTVVLAGRVRRRRSHV